MITISKIGEDIIKASIREFDVADEKEKIKYAERMAAKISAVMDMSEAKGSGQPLQKRPMSSEDINNIRPSEDETITVKVQKLRDQKNYTVKQISDALGIEEKKVREILKFNREMKAK